MTNFKQLINASLFVTDNNKSDYALANFKQLDNASLFVTDNNKSDCTLANFKQLINASLFVSDSPHTNFFLNCRLPPTLFLKKWPKPTKMRNVRKRGQKCNSIKGWQQQPTDKCCRNSHKRTRPFVFQINRKMVNTIWFQVDLIRFLCV